MLAFSTPMTGASLVMPGAKLDGPSIYELLDKYKVTFTAGVPTVWLMLFGHVDTAMELPEVGHDSCVADDEIGRGGTLHHGQAGEREHEQCGAGARERHGHRRAGGARSRPCPRRAASRA